MKENPETLLEEAEVLNDTDITDKNYPLEKKMPKDDNLFPPF